LWKHENKKPLVERGLFMVSKWPLSHT